MGKAKKSEYLSPKEQVDTEVNKSVEQEKVVITSGVEDDRILECDKDGCFLQFDEEDFRELPSEVVDQLSRDNIVRYMYAERDHRNLTRPDRVERTPGISMKLDFGGGNALNRINNLGDPRFKDNPDWHPAWKRPDEVDEAKRAGYDSTGKTLNGPDGKLDLVEVVIPQKRFDEHYDAVVKESKARTHRSLEGAVSEIDGIYPDGMSAVNTTTSTQVPKSFDEE